jgi:hypothetical protein
MSCLLQFATMRCEVEYDQHPPFRHIKPRPQPLQHLSFRQRMRIFLIQQSKLQMACYNPSQKGSFRARQRVLNLCKKLLWQNTGHTNAKQRKLSYRRRRAHLDFKSAIIPNIRRNGTRTLRRSICTKMNKHWHNISCGEETVWELTTCEYMMTRMKNVNLSGLSNQSFIMIGLTC